MLYFSENVLGMYTCTPTKYPGVRDARNQGHPEDENQGGGG
jgi:hypothetical protein